MKLIWTLFHSFGQFFFLFLTQVPYSGGHYRRCFTMFRSFLHRTACLSLKWSFDKIVFSFSILCVPVHWPRVLCLLNTCMRAVHWTAAWALHCPALTENAWWCYLHPIATRLFAFFFLSKWLFLPSHQGLWGVLMELFKQHCVLPDLTVEIFFPLLLSVVTGRCVLDCLWL